MSLGGNYCLIFGILHKLHCSSLSCLFTSTERFHNCIHDDDNNGANCFKVKLLKTVSNDQAFHARFINYEVSYGQAYLQYA